MSIGLNGALAMGAKALNNYQVAVETAGRNVSNANTPGASRQRVNLATDLTITTAYGQQGTGSYVQSISGIRDRLLDASVVRESSLDGYYETLTEQLSLIQNEIGEGLATSTSTTPTSTGIQEAMNEFFDAWQSLSAEPTNDSYRQQVLSSAENLVHDFNDANQRLLAQQADIASDASAVTESINTLAQSIADFNKQIARAESGGINSNSANDLRDQRQLALEQLASLVDINVDDATYTNGMVIVSLAADTSITLVDGASAGGAGGTETLSAAYNAGAYPPLTVVASTSGTISNAVAQTMTGQLGADLHLANVVIGSEASVAGGNTGLLGSLDQLALSLVSTVNTIHSAGYDNETPPQTGINFFAPATTGAGDLAIAVTNIDRIAASNNTGPLDGSNATALGNLRTTSNLLPDYQSIVSDLGQQVSQAESQQKTQMLISKAVQNQRNSVSGINVDEELISMEAYQKAYQASARFISVINEMLQTVINMR